MKVQIAPSKALGYAQITGLTVVKTVLDGLNIAGAASLPSAGAHYAVIQASGAAVRWTDNGETPTATKGMRILDGGELQYAGDFSLLKFIQEAATAQLNISYYKPA